MKKDKFTIDKLFLRWLAPGLGIKRWLLLMIFGMALIGLGIGYVQVQLYRIVEVPDAQTWDQIMTTFAHALGVEPHIVHVPSEFIDVHWPKFKGSFAGDKGECLVFDNSKLKRYVPGFAAKIPFAEGIRRSIAYYRAHTEMQIMDEKYNLESDELIRRYRGL